jgi:putative effector of murein hydrolase LrgA (UPF0299 family)
MSFLRPITVGSTPRASSEAAVVKTFCVLLAFQCLGETISYATAAPVPGPVLGMVLFLCVLCAAPSLSQHVENVSRSLLNHLSLLFVPAGVGVMVFAGELKVQLLAIGVALIVSTILAIAVAALVTSALMVRAERNKVPMDGVQASNQADVHPD